MESCLHVASLRRLHRQRKLVLPESRLKRHRMRIVDLPGIRKASDKPSDNGTRRRQTRRDALRQRYPCGLR